MVVNLEDKEYIMLPEFTYLDEVDQTIISDIRYSGNLNFLGKPVDGYCANRSVLTKVLAETLIKVQKEVMKDGYSLVIYETYRPHRATKEFIKWAEDLSETKMQKLYYPYIDKSKVFELGFISKQSAHSRGSTVDLTLIELGKNLKSYDKIEYTKRKLNDGREFTFVDDGTLDMGSHFDLFDEASFHEHAMTTDLIDEKYMSRRKYLRDVMISNGFDDYRKEWWHYRLIQEPFPQTNFDFEIA
jgi:D-alanyl-D-alanine dipeptidase